jgi:HEAT repeat protein
VNDAEFVVALELAPRAGSIWATSWVGGKLHVASDELLTRRCDNRPTPGLLSFEDAEVFALCPTTGQVEAVSPAARDPAAYYLRRLNAPSAVRRAEAAFALGQLGAVETLPELRDALEREEDPATRDDMATAIKALSTPR